MVYLRIFLPPGERANERTNERTNERANERTSERTRKGGKYDLDRLSLPRLLEHRKMQLEPTQEQRKTKKKAKEDSENEGKKENARGGSTLLEPLEPFG